MPNACLADRMLVEFALIISQAHALTQARCVLAHSWRRRMPRMRKDKPAMKLWPYVVVAYIVMAIYSYGLYSYGHSYGLYSYGHI